MRRLRRSCSPVLPFAFLLSAQTAAAVAGPEVDALRPVVIESASPSPVFGAALALTLTGTLDLTHDECGDATDFAVPPGTDVRFCYFAFNVGTTTFELHDLADSGGTIFTDLPQTLEPGFAMYLMQTRQPTAEPLFTATWTATDASGEQGATDTDSAAITALPPVVGCNLPPTTFTDGIPVGWTSFDWLAMAALPDSDVDWKPLGAEGCLEIGNWTGGRGDAACASSAAAGPGDYDTQLRSHLFSLAGVAEARVAFRLNYQDAAAGGDAFTVDVSDDGGLTWDNVAGANDADFGAFRALPGAQVVLDLTPYAGQADLRIGFRYVNHAGGAHDLYAQVDDVAILCDGGLFFDGFESGDTEAWGVGTGPE